MSHLLEVLYMQVRQVLEAVLHRSFFLQFGDEQHFLLRLHSHAHQQRDEGHRAINGARYFSRSAEPFMGELVLDQSRFNT